MLEVDLKDQQLQDMQLQALDCNSVSEEGMGGRSEKIVFNEKYFDDHLIQMARRQQGAPIPE